MRVKICRLMVMLSVFLFCVSSVGIASADERSGVSDIVKSAEELVGIDAGISVEFKKDAWMNSTETVDGNLHVASTFNDSILINKNTTSNSVFTIPNADAGSYTVEDGIIVAESKTTESVEYAISAYQTGNVRIHSISSDKMAPERYEYQFPNIDSIILDGDTGTAFLFSLHNDKYELVGGVDAPWAVDAVGNAVPSHFEVNGNVLVQVVEHRNGDYVYPITADPSWWDNVKDWFKNAGASVVSKAKSAANWLKGNSKWLAGKTWSGVKIVGKGAKIVGKKIGPFGVALCLVGGGWAWYRSDASGWVRVGDAAAGCFL